MVGLLRLRGGLLRHWRLLGHGHLARVGRLGLVLLGGGRLLVRGRLDLLLLLLPGGGLLRGLLVGARGLLRGPVAWLLLVGLRMLLVAWVLQVHRNKGREVSPLGLQLGGWVRPRDCLSGIVTKEIAVAEDSWPCAAAAWQSAVLQSTLSNEPHCSQELRISMPWRHLSPEAAGRSRHSSAGTGRMGSSQLAAAEGAAAEGEIAGTSADTGAVQGQQASANSEEQVSKGIVATVAGPGLTCTVASCQSDCYVYQSIL